MFSKLLNKMLGAESVSSCYEVKTSTGLTITTIGEYGLEKAVQTLTRLGLICSLASEQPEQAGTPVTLSQNACSDVTSSYPVPLGSTIAHPADAHPNSASRSADAHHAPFVPFVDGYDLKASIKAACQDALSTNLEQVNTKIEELMTLAEGEGNLLLSEARQQFLAGFDRTRIHHSSLADYEFVFQTFIDLVGDKKLNTIKSADVTKYLTALAHYPSSASKKTEFKGKSFSDIVRLAKDMGAKAIRISTQKKHINYLRAFFNWCYEKLDLRRNPMLSVSMKRYKRSKEQVRTPFETDDLQKIFDPRRTRRYKKPHYFLAPLIALYSGMRVNEIMQMAVSDIIFVETGFDLDGQPIKVPCFQVQADTGGKDDGDKHTKTENSDRVIPIHSKLLELGLLAYVDDARRRGFKYLFPGVKRGKNGPGAVVSAWFNNSLLRTKCEILDKSKTFHAFRGTFWTLGDRSKVLVTAMRKLVGYSPGDSVERIHYIRRADVRECKEALESIQYPALDLASYNPQQFEKYLDSAMTKAKPDDLVEVVVKKKPGRPAGSKNQAKMVLAA